MSVSPDDAKGWLAVGSAVGGFFLGLVVLGKNIQKRIFGRIENLEKSHDQMREYNTELATLLAKMNEDFKSRLYKQDGGLVYVQAIDCEKMQANCLARVGVERIEKKVDRLIDMHLKDGGRLGVD